jgi:hypothetical protein
MAVLTKKDIAEVVEASQANMKQQVAQIHKAYFGNGNPGIKTEVAVLKTRVVLLYGMLGVVGMAVLAIIGKLIASHLGG